MKISIIIPTIKKDLGLTGESIKKYTKDYEIVTSDKKGFNIAINDAVSRAKGDYLVFIHDDIEVTEGWVDDLDDSGVLLVNEPDVTPDIWGAYYPGGYNTDPNAHPDYSFFLCLSKSLIKKVFPLDENIKSPWCQDVDFGFSIKEAGYKLNCLPGRIIHHHIGGHINNRENTIYVKDKWGV